MEGQRRVGQRRGGEDRGEDGRKHGVSRGNKAFNLILDFCSFHSYSAGFI